MPTKIINYTQLPNLRVIKNKDFKTVVGERSKFNIGLGIPNFDTFAELPADNICKSGDIAFDDDKEVLVIFTADGWKELVPQNPDFPFAAYGGFKIGVIASFDYLQGINVPVPFSTLTAFPTAGNLAVDIVTGRITNNGPSSMDVSINVNVSFVTEDAQGTSITPSLMGNGVTTICVGAPLLLSNNSHVFSTAISVIATLAPNDYISLFAEADANSRIFTDTLNLTVQELLNGD